MSAYVIVDIKVNEPVIYEEYKTLAATTVTSYGGRYLVRGGQTETLEGEWVPNRLVILQFDCVARAKEWLESAEYSKARQLRHRSAISNMVVVEGVA